MKQSCTFIASLSNRLLGHDGNVEKPHLFRFGIGFILIQSKKGGAFHASASGLPPVKIPEQGLAGGTSPGVFLSAPNGPKRRVIAFELVAAG